MRRHALILFTGLCLFFVTDASAQPVNFSGTWVLDPSRSTLLPGGGLARLGDGGSPGRLHITHSANGDVTLLSEVNESQARTYKVETESPIPVSQDIDMTVTSHWQGSSFIVEGQREGADISAVRRVLSLSTDGSVLTIEASSTSTTGTNTAVLMYTRTDTVPACETWSTPCDQ